MTDHPWIWFQGFVAGWVLAMTVVRAVHWWWSR